MLYLNDVVKETETSDPDVSVEKRKINNFSFKLIKKIKLYLIKWIS